MRPTLIASMVTATALFAATSVQPQKAQKAKPSIAPIAVDVPAIGGPASARISAVSKTGPGAPALVSPSCPPGSPPDSSFKVYGYYNDSTHAAVEGEVWTFDHGAGGWEGWTREDLTENPFTAFQHVDAALWAAHNNAPSAPLISGAGSVWLGFHEDEADSACWAAGLGYGNDWAQRFVSPLFTNSSGSSVDIAFDYWYDSEPGYDFTRVIINTGGPETTIATFTGQSGSPTSPIAFNQNVAVTGPFRVIFEFTSDAGWSDEDGLFTTTLGAFGMDNFDVSGLEGNSGPPLPHDFDTSLEGWIPAATPGIGGYAALNDFTTYTLPGCGQADNVASFHNGSLEHPAGQHERITSPSADISEWGTVPLTVWGQYDIYADLALADSVFWTWGFQYYPYVCPATGDSTWSEPKGPNLIFYSSSAQCRTFRSHANSLTPQSVSSSGQILVPAGADSVRFYLEVRSLASTNSGNETPLFDNIQIGVSDASIVINVPSPQYPTIQEGIDAADPGDIVLVAPGTYTGSQNRDLDFGGTDLVLMSEGGPSGTVIDCERLGRGLHFHSGETSVSFVDGFTFIHGSDQVVGGAIYVTNSSPTIRNCRVSETTVVGSAYGVVRIDSGSPTFECCVVTEDTTAASGGVVRVEGGSPVFDSCTISVNDAWFSCVTLAGGAPTLTDCEIAGNVTANAVITSTAVVMTGCSVTDNSGVGMYFFPAAASTVTSCSFSENADGGIAMETNSSTFTSCTFNANGGPGITITNVATRAVTGAQSSSSAAAGITATSPYFYNCTIAGNVNTSSSGGGVLFDCSNVPVTAFAPVYDNCIITGNSSLFSGGGIAVCGQAVLTDIAPVFTNCTVSANNAGIHGGGFYVAADNGGSEVYSGYVTIVRSIMWGNCADGVGDQAYLETDNSVSFDCSNFDMPGIEGSGDVILVSTQALEDPEFCEASTCTQSGTIEGDFTIAEGSPADPVMSPCGQLIGANPVLCAPPPIGIADSPARTALWPNVPNPFNPTTSIRFDLARSAHVTLTVYDVGGRVVRRLVDAHVPASSRTVVWDGRDDRGTRVATGVYFARLVTPALVETRKMVLIK